MKKIFTLIVIATCLFGSVNAQDEKFSLGLRAGLNIASMSNGGSASVNFGGNSSSVKNGALLGIHGGVYSEIKINDMFSIQPEILYSMKGSKYESSQKSGSISQEVDSKTSLSYLDIPIQMRFNFGKFNILAGPYIGILMAHKSTSKTVQVNGSTTVTTESENTDKDGLNTADVGLYLGAGYQLENGLGFAVRWCKGFSDITDDGGSIVSTSRTHSVFQFSVSYRLFGK